VSDHAYHFSAINKPSVDRGSFARGALRTSDFNAAIILTHPISIRRALFALDFSQQIF
jgi:hypothetical protein